MSPYDSRRWTSHLFDIEGSMVREIMGRVTVCIIWATIFVAIQLHGPSYFPKLAISPTTHSLVGAVLGLLLVFRTNSSYDRFWEGRKLWGGITNECRNLGRQVSSWLKADQALVHDIINWTAAFPMAVVQRLRGNATFHGSVKGIQEQERQAVQTTVHPALAVVHLITARLKLARDRGLIDSIQLASLDQNLNLLVDYCGACERIRTTPLPFAYTVHLRRVLLLYCFTLPFALVKDMGWGSVIVTMLVSYAFFGIEEIGVEIEDPFGLETNDLPLETFCAGIELALTEFHRGNPVLPIELPMSSPATNITS